MRVKTVALFAAVGLALAWWLASAIRGDVSLGAALAGTFLILSARFLVDRPPIRQDDGGDGKGYLAAVAGGVLPRWYLELRLVEEAGRHRRDGRSMVVVVLRSPSLRRERELAGRLLPHAGIVGWADRETLVACLTRCDRQQSIPILRNVMAELSGHVWQVGLSVLPDDGDDSEDLLGLALRRLMPWRAAAAATRSSGAA